MAAANVSEAHQQDDFTLLYDFDVYMKKLCTENCQITVFLTEFDACIHNCLSS